jgi:hypothetical protein
MTGFSSGIARIVPQNARAGQPRPSHCPQGALQTSTFGKQARFCSRCRKVVKAAEGSPLSGRIKNIGHASCSTKRFENKHMRWKALCFQGAGTSCANDQSRSTYNCHAQTHNSKSDGKQGLRISSHRIVCGRPCAGHGLRGAPGSANWLRSAVNEWPIPGFVRHKRSIRRGRGAANAPGRPG